MALTCGEGGSTGFEVIQQINKNETDIATNASDITALNGRVTTLEGLHDYTDATGKDILDIPDTYTTLAEFTTPMSAGRYVLGFSVTHQFDSTNTSTFFQLTVNGSVEEFREEAKDVTDRRVFTYFFPLDWAGGSFNAKVEAKKETTAGTLNVLYANIMLDKKE